MKQEEYVKTDVYNGHMYNVGVDDYGQQYFIEYMNENGELAEECCGAYNANYMGAVEALFGGPELCEHYDHPHIDENGLCKQKFSHGYCGNCPNAIFTRNTSATTTAESAENSN